MGAAEHDGGGGAAGRATGNPSRAPEPAIREALEDLAEPDQIDQVLQRALLLAGLPAVPTDPGALERFVSTELSFAADNQLGSGAGRLLTRHLADLWERPVAEPAPVGPWGDPGGAEAGQTGLFPRSEAEPLASDPAPSFEAPPVSGTRPRADAEGSFDQGGADDAVLDPVPTDDGGVGPSSAGARSTEQTSAGTDPALDDAELDLAPAAADETWVGELPLDARNDTPSRRPDELEAKAVETAAFGRVPRGGLLPAVGYFLRTYGRRDVLRGRLRAVEAAIGQGRFDLAFDLSRFARALGGRTLPNGSPTRRELAGIASAAGRFARVAPQTGVAERLSALAELLRTAPRTAAATALEASRRAVTLRALSRAFTRVALRARGEGLGDLAGIAEGIDISLLELASLEEEGTTLCLAQNAYDPAAYRRGRVGLVAGVVVVVTAVAAAFLAAAFG
ncbi:MAG TPA: hypothetical protein RMF84_02730 [Polyangiaceae bacterium LLY-WYZ-14_1]|nr:hypothetical protein [Polyangiaceae bacterium LLY-WYZ-14_1]